MAQQGSEPVAPPPEFEVLIEHLRDSRGVDFTGYKRASLQRRVDRRMQQIEVDSYDDYVDLLQVRPDEFTHLFNTVLINVTGFFRDPDAWEQVRTEVIPRLIENHKPSEPLRIWSAGCASGEEPYTLAMLFAEELGLDETRERVKIYATDIDEDALAEARVAAYDLRSVNAVPDDIRARYFEPAGTHFTIRKELRRSVIFGRNDLVQDAPISRIDLLVCRNTLMYLNAETQTKVLDRFHFALDDEGFLFLGKAEMLLSHGELFTPLDLKRRLFRKVGSTGLRDRAAAEIYGRRPSGAPATPPSTLAQLVHESLYTGPFAQVIVDAESRLSFANARAQSMFTIGPRDVGRPFQDLELSYRPVELRGLIDRVSDERRPIELKDVEWVRGVGDTVVLDVAAVPLIGPQGTVIGASVTLMDVTRYRRLQEEHELATRQLEMAYEELQSTNEELETTNEELQSTVEELETTNEELQSTNEELETMNEELHSTNDELQVINDELRERSRELAELGDFMDAVMAGLQVGVIVVDVDMRVIVWNEQSYDLWGLRSDEAVGAHLLNLDIGLPTDKLRPAVRRIIAGDVEISTEELPARNRRGRELTVQVTSTPLAGPQGISGCILAMSAVDGSPREEGT